MKLRSIARACALACLACLLAAPATAQESYPNQGVRFIVAFAPGGPTDIVGRLLAQKLQEKWGQSVVVENRGGAGGNVATRAVAKADPNGYTVLVTTSAYAVNPSLSANAGFSPETDFKVAIIAATSPNLIVAAPTLKVSTLAEAIELAKTEKLNYGTAGPGTTPHLSAERIFRLLAKVDIAHVPFTGAGPAMTAILGGHVALGSIALPAAMELVKDGKVKALAITSTKRLASLPDVPTASELGFGPDEDSTWVALFLPAATPAAIVQKINADINAVLADKEMGPHLERVGLLPVGGTIAASETYVRSEIVRWAEVIKRLGLKAE